MISKETAYQKVYSRLRGFWSKNNVPVIFQKGEKITIRKKVKKLIKNEKGNFRNIRDVFNNIRDKAILLCKLSCGIDDQDLFALKISDFKDGYYEEFNVGYIEGNRIKPVGNPYQAILNSDACDLINMYFFERNRKNAISPEDYLFVNLKTQKKIGNTAFADNLRIACKILKIEKITPKYIRKYCNMILKKGGIPKDIVERMLGYRDQFNNEIFEREEFVKDYADIINEITNLSEKTFQEEFRIMKKIIQEKDGKIEKMEKDLKDLMNKFKEISKFTKKFHKKDKKINKKRVDVKNG